jgi:hypothetical protein
MTKNMIHQSKIWCVSLPAEEHHPEDLRSLEERGAGDTEDDISKSIASHAQYVETEGVNDNIEAEDEETTTTHVEWRLLQDDSDIVVRSIGVGYHDNLEPSCMQLRLVPNIALGGRETFSPYVATSTSHIEPESNIKLSSKVPRASSGIMLYLGMTDGKIQKHKFVCDLENDSRRNY